MPRSSKSLSVSLTSHGYFLFVLQFLAQPVILNTQEFAEILSVLQQFGRRGDEDSDGFHIIINENLTQ